LKRMTDKQTYGTAQQVMAFFFIFILFLTVSRLPNNTCSIVTLGKFTAQFTNMYFTNMYCTGLNGGTA